MPSRGPSLAQSHSPVSITLLLEEVTGPTNASLWQECQPHGGKSMWDVGCVCACAQCMHVHTCVHVCTHVCARIMCWQGENFWKIQPAKNMYREEWTSPCPKLGRAHRGLLMVIKENIHYFKVYCNC